MSNSRCRSATLAIGSALMLVLWSGGCTGSHPWAAPCLEPSQNAPLHGVLMPGCRARTHDLECYGFHDTCWYAWPVECGRCDASGEVTQPDSAPQ